MTTIDKAKELEEAGELVVETAPEKKEFQGVFLEQNTLVHLVKLLAKKPYEHVAEALQLINSLPKISHEFYVQDKK